MKKILSAVLIGTLALSLAGCGQRQTPDGSQTEYNSDNNEAAETGGEPAERTSENPTQEIRPAEVPENFVLIEGGSFQMGSPETEAWRGEDETQHSVTVSDFYMSRYELTQAEYEAVMGENPGSFSGDDLPVENVTWLEAVAYCNARSGQEGLTPVYEVEDESVSWNRSADGYRLPTEAEWEYACRAGTETPFYMENSPGAEEANYYGHYPYMIEENYFSQGELTVQPGEYRQTTVPVGSFEANPFGLYDMHGNVGEWTWDLYGDYPADGQTDPTGAQSGTRRVYRGGGWNDFAKNMRSAYRAMMDQDKSSFNVGIRLVRNAAAGNGSVEGAVLGSGAGTGSAEGGNVLIAYFSWGGNTRGIAEEIRNQTGADLFEITLVNPYSDDYNTVLDEAQRDQNEQARPELAAHVENMEDYDTIILGYPNWWASIPMPIASFLEEYDFTGKTIIPFCSHGGGRFGQSLTAIAKLVPDAGVGEALSVHYSGGESLADDVNAWLEENGITVE